MPENNEEQPDFESRLIENNAFVDMAIWDFWVRSILCLFEINYQTSNFIWTYLVTAARVASVVTRNLFPALGRLSVGRNYFICVVALRFFNFGIKF